MAEATADEANPRNPDQAWDYEAVPWTDFAARRLKEAQDAYKQQFGDDADMTGITWIVNKVDLPRK